jgi:hypothetical protein
MGQAVSELVYLNSIRARIRTDKDEAIICRHSVQRVTTADKGQIEFLLGEMLTVSVLVVMMSVFLNTLSETVLVLLPPSTM